MNSPYHHTQTAPLYLILVLVGAGILVSTAFVPERIYQIVLAIAAGMMFFFAISFRQLTVSDEGDSLLVAFGPLPVFRRRIPYASMTSASQGRSTILDGWGIHVSPSGGWVWNLWGFECVDVHRKELSKVRIGTDDPDGLEAFLNQRIQNEAR